MDYDEPCVVVWAVPKNEIEVPCWLMVRHIERGWELPGGKQHGTSISFLGTAQTTTQGSSLSIIHFLHDFFN